MLSRFVLCLTSRQQLGAGRKKNQPLFLFGVFPYRMTPSPQGLDLSSVSGHVSSWKMTSDQGPLHLHLVLEILVVLILLALWLDFRQSWFTLRPPLILPLPGFLHLLFPHWMEFNTCFTCQRETRMKGNGENDLVYESIYINISLMPVLSRCIWEAFLI